jgi:ParB-like chromosome segregation protein Spo0J
LDHDPIRERSLRGIWLSPENNQLYRPVTLDDPSIQSLAASIEQCGVLEPLIITADSYIVSCHRRFAAAALAGLATLPCRTINIRREDDIDAFVKLLREHNRQRDKTRSEKFRELLVDANADEAHEALIEYRRAAAAVDVIPMVLNGRRRAELSPAKLPMLKAVKAVVKKRRKFWPLSDRQIHYALLNNPPLRHASKPDSR